MLYVHVCVCIHTLGGVGWEPPPRGPHWDLLANLTKIIITFINYCNIIFILTKTPHSKVASRCKVFPISFFFFVSNQNSTSYYTIYTDIQIQCAKLRLAPNMPCISLVIYNSRTAVPFMWGSLRLAPINIIYGLRAFVSSMWGSLRLAPIILVTMFEHHWGEPSLET